MTANNSNGKFANFFGLVFLFGLFLLTICIYREEEIILLMVTKPITIVRVSEFRNLSDKDQQNVENGDLEEKFDFPILEGWPPGENILTNCIFQWKSIHCQRFVTKIVLFKSILWIYPIKWVFKSYNFGCTKTTSNHEVSEKLNLSRRC